MEAKESEELQMLKNFRAYLNDEGKDRLIILLIAEEHELERQIKEYTA